MGDNSVSDDNGHSFVDHVIRKLITNPDKCPEYGTPEHRALGGGAGPVYEPLRYSITQPARGSYERFSSRQS